MPSNDGRTRGRMARRLDRVLLLALSAAAIVVMTLAIAPHRRPIERVSFATAYASLAFLAATLVTGPLLLLRGRPNPVSTDLRRDLGIAAGVCGVAHTLIGLQVHLTHRWQYFLSGTPDGGPTGVRGDPFGIANHAGLAAALMLLVLLAISTDRALAQLGRVRWKWIQRLSYPAALLVVGHAVIFQIIEHRAAGAVVLLVSIVLVTVALQWLGVRAWRRADVARTARRMERRMER